MNANVMKTQFFINVTFMLWRSFVIFFTLRPYYNLDFVLVSLFSLDILPVFILDGEAPKLKAQTMDQRNLATWGPRSTSTSAQSQITSSPKVKKRRQFTGVLKVG